MATLKWTEDLIIKMVMEVVHKEKLTYFPTHEEMINYYQSKALSNAISRSGGTVYFAKKIGLPMKSSDTTTGLLYESKAIEDIYIYTGLKSAKMPPRYPYDLFVDNSVKIDVKVSHPTLKKKNTALFTFNLEKEYPTCDFYIAYCVSDDEAIVKTLIIPADKLTGMKQLTVGPKSKYDIYRNRWDYIKRYNAYCKALAKRVEE